MYVTETSGFAALDSQVALRRVVFGELAFERFIIPWSTALPRHFLNG